MLRRFLVFILYALIALMTPVGAQTLPQPSSWTMYAIGSYTSSNHNPLLESQAAAADGYFKAYSLITAQRACWRIFWNDTRSGPYTDMGWKDKQWYPCTVTGTVTTLNSTTGIAVAITCTAGSLDDRCFAYGSASNSKNVGRAKCDGQVGCGNPIDPGTGNKYQAELDFEVPGSPWLTFVRHYNSSASIAVNPGGFARRWRHSLEYRLVFTAGGAYELHRPDGSVKTFTSSGADLDENGNLGPVLDAQGVQSGWVYADRAQQTEFYDLRGRVTRIDFTRGGQLTYAYASATHDFPSSVTDHFGRVVSFAYDSTYNRITQVTTPGNAVYQYAYSTAGFLSTVTKPGAAVRTYVMDESAHDASTDSRGHLTGIVDELNNRFATFKYDKYGRAYSTEHAGGSQKFTVAYGADGVTNTVTTPAGSTKQFTFASVLGIMKATASSTACSDGGCGQADEGAFDVRGNRTYRIAEDGSKTCYAFDQTRNLLLRQVQGLADNADCTTALASPPGTARVTSIDWHVTFRQPVTIAEPLRVISFTYDTSERVLSVTETATSDASGAEGTAAVGSGASRTIAYGYNAVGQVTSISGPKYGEAQSFVYDGAGNLTSSTNAANHVTSYGNHDGDGRPQSMTLPSGASIILQYDARGHLKTFTEEGETTTLNYNAAGLLSSVLMPSGETLTYGYDTAQRLTSVTDARNQKLSYTLNGAGQPTAQQVAYASGTVAASVTRVFDMLGRIKQVTGAQHL